ncbi:translation initiation factor IF-2 subunit gamma [Candidatus Woesearchaeota archaeon]|nr:MAG: translation initiation factor IF-2 subunit gamma [Candidatus Woesearchaeota archaeon]
MAKKKAASKETDKKAAAVKKDAKSAQPEVNIGIIGHVDHGKTTLVQALSGKWADTHSEEMKRGITIRLGYADVAFYKCPKCKGVEAYVPLPECPHCKSKTKLLRKLSLVDAPGHESLMATMLCGANIMDGAILLVSATESCPQPQTREHLQALEIVGLKNVIVIQNKIDLVSEEEARRNYEEIKEFLASTPYSKAPIIPMSALHSINLDYLIKTIEEVIKTPERDLSAKPMMFIARSFDINKPGTKPEKLVGGVIGGALKQGVLTEDDEIEIVPGYLVVEKNQQVWKPLRAKITSLMAGGERVLEVKPGGTIAIMTTLDPSVVKSDSLVGNVVTRPGESPPCWSEIKIQPHLMERVVGAKDKLVVEPLKQGEILMLNVNTAATVGVVKELGKTITFSLKKPVCAEIGSRVAMSRRLGQRWRLIGYGIIE